MSANLNRQTEDFEDLNFQEESMPKYQEITALAQKGLKRLKH